MNIVFTKYFTNIPIISIDHQEFWHMSAYKFYGMIYTFDYCKYLYIIFQTVSLGNVYIFVYSFMYVPAIVDQPLLYPVIIVPSRQSRTPFNAGQSPNPWRRGVCSLVPVSATLNLTKCDKLRNYFSQKMFSSFNSVLCFFIFCLV